MTCEIVTPRKHCRPRRSRSLQCFPRGDDLPCHPVKNVIFILLCRMSKFPSQLHLCVLIKFVHRATFYLNVTRCYDVGQHFTWMLPVATTLLRMPRRPPMVSLFEQYAHLFHAVNNFSECYPPLYILCKNYVTFKIFKQLTDQWNYRKLTWGIINNLASLLFLWQAYAKLLLNMYFNVRWR